MEVVEHRGEAGGVATRWLQAGDAPVLYLHGVPTASWQWERFLARTGGVAPDLPGFGGSSKRSDFDYSIPGYDRWLEAFADHLGLDRLALVVEDWGGVGLAFAQRFPQRIERLVLFSTVPLLPGYRWHRIARVWRTPLLGELFHGLSSKWAFRRLSHEANVSPGPLPDWFLDRIWADYDHGTQRAILKLYRSAPEHVLAGAGSRLAELRCPALILWPTDDPYIPARFGQAYADALGGDVTLEMVEAGHWSWLERPELVDRVAEFLVA